MDGRENLPELTRPADLAEGSQLPTAPAAGSGNGLRRTRVPWLRSLSAKILGLTVVFIMVSEAVILLPSIAKFRNDYFSQKIETAGVAAGALLAMESQALGQADIDIVLDSVGAESLAVMRGYESRLLTMQEVPGDVAYHVDVELDWRLAKIHQRPRQPTIHTHAVATSAAGSGACQSKQTS